MRTVQILVAAQFIPGKWEDLEDGDIIKLFEPDGTPVCDDAGYDMFKVSGKPDGNVLHVDAVPNI